MKVLVADFDLFSRTGGGQTVYRNVIEKNPKIEFYYLTTFEKADMIRPSNARPIHFQQKYFQKPHRGISPLNWCQHAYLLAQNIAWSVADQEFDVVDVPDYDQAGAFLRPALREHGVRFERLVLSMHGRISTTLQLNWYPIHDLDLKRLEELQYAAVDLRYAISKTYISEWRAISPYAASYLHPFYFLALPKPTLGVRSPESPSLTFLGRTEKRKGPDLFLELLWWLPRSSFSHASIVGPQSHDNYGMGANAYLSKIARYRFPDAHIHPEMNEGDLAKLFSSKTVMCLPSRYDTLNLVALESLLAGCPTIVGNGAGVVAFLREQLPKVPFVTLNIRDVYSCLPAVTDVLHRYEWWREKLVHAVLESEFEPSGPTLVEIYANNPDYDCSIRRRMETWYYELLSSYSTKRSMGDALKSRLVSFARAHLSDNAKSRLARYRSLSSWPAVKQACKNHLLNTRDTNDLRIVAQAARSLCLWSRYREIYSTAEATDKDIRAKLQKCWELAEHSRVDRVRLWREIARLERMRGNNLLAATYELRVMRLLERDQFGTLGYVVTSLEEGGYHREARVADAMYGPDHEREERCASLLAEALAGNRTAPGEEYEFIDDRRQSGPYKAAVIVSLYNAADKLPLFLRMFQNQTLLKYDAVELILIDSGSPSNEYPVFKDCLRSLTIPAVYARTAKRESIQSAWNRGIVISRAPYLSFLGVDEAILPNCLELLCDELDKDTALDWVIGHSLVTNVDRDGVLVDDIMLYDRTGYRQDLVYLETCYLSWVGALYRRSIHDRFGFYDGSFRATGDTEFKNRILPHIRSKAIPCTLGVFRNYPEERTTQSPQAEIEDLRAWYLHRTLAGVRHAFSRRDPQEAEELFYASLCYRKSFCQHWSTDIEYAHNLALFLDEKMPDSPALKLREGIKEVLDSYRSLDWIEKMSRVGTTAAVLRTARSATKTEGHHKRLVPQGHGVLYRIFNDNRHEQHRWVWKSDS